MLSTSVNPTLKDWLVATTAKKLLSILNESNCWRNYQKNLMYTKDWQGPLLHPSMKMKTSKKEFCCNFLVGQRKIFHKLVVEISGLKSTFCFVETLVHPNPNFCNMFTIFCHGPNILQERVLQQ